MENFSFFVPRVYFEQIAIKNLVSSQDYQRNLSAVHIERLAENFDLYQINPVKISRRDGINYVFDGQHTAEAVAAVSGSRDTPVWCMVYDDLEYVHEADIFANQQKHTRPLSPFEIFSAHLEADSDLHYTIKSIVESCGLEIVRTRRAGGICAVYCLEQIFNNHGYGILHRALRLLVASWEGDTYSLSANMIKGAARLVAAYGEAIKDDIFARRVGSTTAREIARTAKERREGSMGYAEVMLGLYNKKTKQGLPPHKLHSA
jgi:hypothetical protein